MVLSWYVLEEREAMMQRSVGGLLKYEFRKLGLVVCRLGLEGRRLGLEGRRLGLEGRRLGLEGRRLGLEGRRLGRLGLVGLIRKDGWKEG
jgi:hypothetical protein